MGYVMYDNTLNNSSYQVTNGMHVFDAAGDKVGTIAQYDPQAGYMLVEKGWLFHRDIYIPLSAINNSDQNGVYLNLYKDDLKDDRYSNPPVMTGTGTATSDTAFVNTGGSTYVTDSNYTGAAYDATATTGATDVTTDTGYTTPGVTSQAEDIRIPVREEELVVGKERQAGGNVHIRKEVIEEPRTVDVPLRHERVSVERVPYSGEVTDAAEAFQEQDIEVPVMDERAVVGKRVTGAEEVRIHKDVVDETQQVSDTVRKERVVVDDATQPDETYNEIPKR